MGLATFWKRAATALGAWLRLAALGALACLWGAGQAAHAQTINRYTNTTDSAGGAISDTASPCSNPFKRTFTVSSSFTVADVNLGLLLAHTYRGDLALTLVSPANTRVMLQAASNTNGGDNFNAVLDDEAGSAITTYTANDTATATTAVPPYNASYSPASTLSAFDGQNAAGTWTLEICDQYAADSGTFYQADLYLAQAPTTYADLSLAMSVSNAAPASGASVSYTLTVSNAASSPSAASGIVVTDLLPAGLSFVSASGSGTYSSATGTWAVGTLAPGQTASLTITASVTASSGASIKNNAEITASSIQDLDSTVNNGAVGEDDYASASLTVAGTRTAGTPPMLTCPAGTALFDWDTAAWTAGSTAGSFAVAGIGTLGLTIANPGVFLSNATYGGQSPTRQNVVTGGLASPQYSLMELVNLTSQASEVTTTLSLSQPAAGAQFTVFDVDYAAGQFADRVTVTGSFNGNTVLPVLTNGISNYVIGNSAYGDATSADNQANGNVVVTFTSPIDTITVSYGNHAAAPADPGQQAVTLHDVTFCKPPVSIGVTKVSSVLSDPVNGSTNPKAIPGAVMEYCVLITNTGLATLSNLVATDPLPASFTYGAGTLLSGASCGGAVTAEDDDNAGADETDPFGASISGTTITASAGSLGAGNAFAIRFRGVIN